MAFRRWLWLVCMLVLLPFCARAQSRVLLIGVDEFVSKPSAAPSSQNNVAAMKTLFEAMAEPPQAITVPDQPVTTARQLQSLVKTAFAGAAQDDVSYLYLSTHGVYDPDSGESPMLLLSDGRTENGIAPKELEAAFDGVPGTKVIILDACNSGAFIGKGTAIPMAEAAFLGEEFKVLTSSGALEESWYWSAGEGMAGQGAFYFTQALAEGMSAHSGYPADLNRDGAVTLSELHRYLLLNHAASTPQVYPQEDDFVLYRYEMQKADGLKRSPVMDVTFSGTTLSRDQRDISIEFIATRPVRVAYQIVYQREGKWEFDNAQLIYDQAERFTAFGDQPGAISAGRKLRTIHLGEMDGEKHGYVLVQLVSIDQGKLTVHAGRVICVPPTDGEMRLTASVDAVLDMSSSRELSIFIGHDYPCTLSVAIVDENEKVVARLCHRQSTRPMQITPEGSVFYWDGTTRDGTKAAPGSYRVRAQAHMNDTTVTVLSSAFTIE